jgi:hypothetical protein
VNAALVAELAKALGHEGFGIPSSREERQKLVASVRNGRPNECALEVDACEVSCDKVEKPQMLPLSQFRVIVPDSEERESRGARRRSARCERGRRGPRRGAPQHPARPPAGRVGGRRQVTPRLLALRLCGCPAPHMTVYTINYRLH